MFGFSALQKDGRDRAFAMACWVLGSLAFLLLLMVGISFSLSERTVVVEKLVEVSVVRTVEAPADGFSHDDPAAQVAAEADDDPAAAVVSGVQPRTVEQMLEEADAADPGNAASPAVPMLADSNPARNLHPQVVEPSPADMMPAMTEDVARLVKEARYAQIEGDLKVAVLKLEQALRLEPDNPVVLYYYGITYEWLRNADKSREFFLKVYTQRDKAGKYFARAAKHLQTGFERTADMRGNMSFGPILEYHDPSCTTGERVTLTVPVLMKDGLNVRPEDLKITIQFFDKVNGKKVERTRVPEPPIQWATAPVDWADGEEIMETTYEMPPLTEEEIIAYGSLNYYGYIAKLYYKGEPMDCHASPPVLFLLDQMQQGSPAGNSPELYDGGLLPPVDAVPVSDAYDPTLLPLP